MTVKMPQLLVSEKQTGTSSWNKIKTDVAEKICGVHGRLEEVESGRQQTGPGVKVRGVIYQLYHVLICLEEDEVLMQF